MNTLVIDIGGTNVKLWRTEEVDKAKLPSGKKFTPQELIDGVGDVLQDWQPDRVSIGFPGEVQNGVPSSEPLNLGPGWTGFDFATAFNCPVRIMNDACMQALGSYEGGKMLYLGLGTGLGSSLVTDGIVLPLALGHLKLWEEGNFDFYLSRAGLRRHGKKRWRQALEEVAISMKNAFFADYVMLGGGNVTEIKQLPEGCRRGGNHNAYFGGLRMWEDLHDAAILKIVPKVAASSA